MDKVSVYLVEKCHILSFTNQKTTGLLSILRTVYLILYLRLYSTALVNTRTSTSTVEIRVSFTNVFFPDLALASIFWRRLLRRAFCLARPVLECAVVTRDGFRHHSTLHTLHFYEVVYTNNRAIQVRGTVASSCRDWRLLLPRKLLYVPQKRCHREEALHGNRTAR